MHVHTEIYTHVHTQKCITHTHIHVCAHMYIHSVYHTHVHIHRSVYFTHTKKALADSMSGWKDPHRYSDERKPMSLCEATLPK